MLAELSSREKELVSSLLPSDRKFYAEAFRDLGALQPATRDEDGTITLGDFDEGSSDVIAIGAFEEDQSYSASISMNGDRDGARLILPDGADSPFWTLSSWSPGSASSRMDPVRVIALMDEPANLKFTFALSATGRVLWLHHAVSQYNQLIPVTGVFIELARQLPQFKTDRLSHEGFFQMAEHATDAMLAQALLDYNKRSRKFDAHDITKHSGRPGGNSGVIDSISNRS